MTRGRTANALRTAAALGAMLVAVPASAAGTEGPVTLDVVVTDAKSRPVGDLKANDLELTVAGEGQAIDAVARPSAGARVIGILLDEFHVRAGEATLRARAALTTLVDHILRDGDLVALVKPLDPLHAITFTGDRALVRQVLASFEGHAGDYTPRTEFERNFMSRDPRTAEITRAQVVSAALQALARRLGEQQQGRKSLILVTEGFKPAQPRAIIYAANRNGVALYPFDPHPDPSDDEPMLRSLADQTGGLASINDKDLAPAIALAAGDLDHYFLLSFTPSGPADGRFRQVQVRLTRAGLQARLRSGYWAPDAALAASAARAESRKTLPFRPSHSSPYIRPWIGMTRGPGGLTSVTVTWEPGASPPRNQRVGSILVKAIANDGTLLLEHRVGAGDVDRATFDAPPGYVALEMAIETSGGNALDTDYRGISVPNLHVTRPTFATPQIFRTRTARAFGDLSRQIDAVPVASRTFSRTERLLIRAPAYGPGDAPLVITAQLLNRRGVPMRQLDVVPAPLPAGTVQFDLPLASLAPDEYRIELTASNATGPKDEAKETVAFRVTN